MTFVINKLKYDTDKMELISDKCGYTYPVFLFGEYRDVNASDVSLWRSVNGRWLITYRKSSSDFYGKALSKEDAANLLIKYDLDKYEKIFGELEEE